VNDDEQTNIQNQIIKLVSTPDIMTIARHEWCTLGAAKVKQTNAMAC